VLGAVGGAGEVAVLGSEVEGEPGGGGAGLDRRLPSALTCGSVESAREVE
jgi:hypothetical protein